MDEYLAKHPAFKDPTSSNSQIYSAYSDLDRQRRSNPAGFRANLDWWQRVLEQATWQAAEDKIVLHLDESLRTALTVQGVGRPLGLGTVIGELQKAGHVVSLPTFLRGSKPISGPGARSIVPSAGAVANALLVKPLGWAFSQLGLSSGDSDDSQDESHWRTYKGDWVLWANLESAATTLLRSHYDAATLSPLDSLFTPASFRAKLAPLKLSEADILVLLRHLVRDRKVALTEPGVIKLSPAEHLPPSPITEQDHGLLSLQNTQRKLELQIAEIERKITERNGKAKAALAAKQKTQALTYLRSRKALEEVLDKRMGSLETVSNVLIKIEQAAGDIELVQAYETSSKTLKAILSDPRLQADRVEDSMRGLEDALADHKEIEDAIKYGEEGARAAAGVQEIDEKELQAEMDMLAKEEEKRIAREAEEKRLQEEQERKERQQQEAEEKRKATEAEQLKAKQQAEEERKREEKQRFEQEVQQEEAERNAIVEQ